MAKKELKIYTVSQTNVLVQTALEASLPSRMIVRGQISDWKHHSSGHCYFLLKDPGGILPCVMWASKFKNVKFAVENGMEILCTGHIDVYLPGGKYQLYVDKMEPAGIGDLQLAFEQMKQRLQKEGLFEDKHKKPIPAFPMRIGIITSPSGAALIDIAESIYNRWPCARLFLYPSPVQGEAAAPAIASAIRQINKLNKDLKLDVLIVGRGGGSLEDLWSFNEEVVARAIYASQIPIISAVGHEVDVTIADLVADARASTPTKAGVIAVPDITEVTDRINQAQSRLTQCVEAELRYSTETLARILASSVFKSPLGPVNWARQQTDELMTKILTSYKHMFSRLRDKLSTLKENLSEIEPHRIIGKNTLRLTTLETAAQAAVKQTLAKKKLQLTAVQNRLKGLNPANVLKRGYSITRSKKTGVLLRTADDIKVGDTLSTELSQVKIESDVKAINKKVK
jgi:exodeoxyribonuclease VII large subunit